MWECSQQFCMKVDSIMPDGYKDNMYCSKLITADDDQQPPQEENRDREALAPDNKDCVVAPNNNKAPESPTDVVDVAAAYEDQVQPLSGSQTGDESTVPLSEASTPPFSGNKGNGGIKEGITQEMKEEIVKFIFQYLATEEDKVVAKSLKSISDLCDADDAKRCDKGTATSIANFIVELGGHIVIAFVIMKNSGNEDIINAGFGALLRITYWTTSDVDPLISTGIYEAAVKAMKEYAYNDQLVLNICDFLVNCLENLSDKLKLKMAESLVLQNKAICRVVSANKASPESTKLLGGAIHFIGRLSDFEDLRLPIVKDGGALILAKAMQALEMDSEDFRKAQTAMRLVMSF